MIEMEMGEKDTQIKGFVAFFPDELISEFFDSCSRIDNDRGVILRIDSRTDRVPPVFDPVFSGYGHCASNAPKFKFQ
ncbi:unnamed protein product, partial [marine sediment metagenome]